MERHEVTHQGEPQSKPFACALALFEGFEYVLEALGRNSGAGVGDADLDLVAIAVSFEANLAAGGGVLAALISRFSTTWAIRTRSARRPDRLFGQVYVQMMATAVSMSGRAASIASDNRAARSIGLQRS
jgi:hypothetical protein